MTHYRTWRGKALCDNGTHYLGAEWSTDPKDVTCSACKVLHGYDAAVERAKRLPRNRRASRRECTRCGWQGKRSDTVTVDGLACCPACEVKGNRGHYLEYAP